MEKVTILGKEYDIAETTSLDLSNAGIADEALKEIAPELAKLTNLTELNLKGNKISDISPLANLVNLMDLDLSDNEISDISPLANLTDLAGLILNGNEIIDTSPLENLTDLQILGLRKNGHIDASLFEHLIHLTNLELDDDQIYYEDKEWLEAFLPHCQIDF